MKRILSIVLIGVLTAATVLYFMQARPTEADGYEILRVYNWEEYISEGEDVEWEDFVDNIDEYSESEDGVNVVYLFESYCRSEDNPHKDHKKVKVEYSTFGTNENMYNELNLSKKSVGGNVSFSYDVVCPSDYMLQKMLAEDMLEKISDDDGYLSNYYEYVSPYILSRLLGDEMSVSGKRLGDYCAGYMWDTMGFLYNPEIVSEEDAAKWDLLWKDEYNNLGTIKDSMRDTYVMAIGYVYKDELEALAEKYADDLTSPEYTRELTAIFDRTDADTVSKVQTALIELKDKIYGYEVDSGKKDMATGKIAINFAWSGDAVYSMDTAEEENDLILNYSIPETGSNIFFDCWAVLKGANVQLSKMFIDFLSRPEIAKLNMSYIGYTSVIAGDVMFENAVDWYGYTTEDVTESIGDDGETRYFTENEDGEEVEVYRVDLNYFFTDLNDNDGIIYVEELGRQFSAQYPDEATVARCTVMKYYDDTTTKKLNDMWETAKVGKTNDLMLLIVIISVILVVALAAAILYLYRKGIIIQPKSPKGYKLTKIE